MSVKKSGRAICGSVVLIASIAAGCGGEADSGDRAGSGGAGACQAGTCDAGVEGGTPPAGGGNGGVAPSMAGGAPGTGGTPASSGGALPSAGGLPGAGAAGGVPAGSDAGAGGRASIGEACDSPAGCVEGSVCCASMTYVGVDYSITGAVCTPAADCPGTLDYAPLCDPSGEDCPPRRVCVGKQGGFACTGLADSVTDAILADCGTLQCATEVGERCCMLDNAPSTCAMPCPVDAEGDLTCDEPSDCPGSHCIERTRYRPGFNCDVDPEPAWCFALVRECVTLLTPDLLEIGCKTDNDCGEGTVCCVQTATNAGRINRIECRAPDQCNGAYLAVAPLNFALPRCDTGQPCPPETTCRQVGTGISQCRPTFEPCTTTYCRAPSACTPTTLTGITRCEYVPPE